MELPSRSILRPATSDPAGIDIVRKLFQEIAAASTVNPAEATDPAIYGEVRIECIATHHDSGLSIYKRSPPNGRRVRIVKTNLNAQVQL